MILVIPVENQVRELDAKLLLACVAAERGLSVVLGSGDHIDFAIPNLPRGLFLAMSMHSGSTRMLRIIRDLGHRILACDEEGLVRYDSPEYYAWRYSADTFKLIDQLFAWGVDDAEFLARYPGNASVAVHVTGNPRTDLLRQEVRGYFASEVDALKTRYGNFVLVNTNFAFVNNFVPELNLVFNDSHGHPRVSRNGRGMSFAFAAGMAAHQQSIFDRFRELIPALAARFPKLRIIVRPHPSENHEVWRQALTGSAQVEVLHHGNVVPWLMAARALLHNGCTTAVEASLLGTPAIAYMPKTSEAYDYHLPNRLSHRARTLEEVYQTLGEIIDGQRGLSDLFTRYQLLDRHLRPEHEMLACDRMIDVLLNLKAPVCPPATRLRLVAWLRCHARTAEKRLKRLRSKHRNSSNYHSHRFPDITTSELNDRISRFSTALKRFNGVRAEYHSRHVFRIHDPAAASLRSRN